jgi:subfamily B ATP-binding cassette protein MsbA
MTTTMTTPLQDNNTPQSSRPKLWRRLLRGYVRQEKRTLAAAIVCMAIAAGATAALAKLMEPVLDEVFVNKSAGSLMEIAGLVLLTFVAKGVATYGETVLMTGVGLRIVARLQQQVGSHLLQADLAYFHRKPTGVLISHVTQDINQLRYAVSNAVTAIGKDSLTLIALLTVMLWQDWQLAFIAFVALPVAILPIRWIGRRVRREASGAQAQQASLSSLLMQLFQGIRYVKAYNAEGLESDRLAQQVAQTQAYQMALVRVKAAAHPLMEALGGIAIVLVIVYGGGQVMEGARTTGSFFSFITALLLAYEPVKRLTHLNANLQEGLASAARVFDLLDEQPQVVDQPGAKALQVSQVSGGQVVFDKVSFSYVPGQPVLQNLSFAIAAGQMVAVVGPSGAGKSTIANLLLRFHEPVAGQVLVDGQDIAAVTQASLRDAIAFVGQEIYLFNDSVSANIAYNQPADEATIQAAAQAASADEFIADLPDGLASLVGELGNRLSGGQRQRIALARAMLRDAPILLLDEATSALDPQSERNVLASLKRLRGNKTTIMIAHRLSTIIEADNILVLADGQLAEQGSHDQLLKRDGVYARLYQQPEEALSRQQAVA